MKVKRVDIVTPVAHCHVPYTTKIQETQEMAHPSVVIGITKILYGQDINNFKLGYTMTFDTKFKDKMITYKLGQNLQSKNNLDNGRFYINGNAKLKKNLIPYSDEIFKNNPHYFIVEMNGKKYLDYQTVSSDVTEREFLYNVNLHIYIETDRELICQYPLGIGKRNCLAHIESEKTIELIEKEGKIKNQYIPYEFGEGMPQRVCMLTWFNKENEKYEHKHELMCLCDEMDYNTNYDEELDNCIYMNNINIRKVKGLC